MIVFGIRSFSESAKTRAQPMWFGKRQAKDLKAKLGANNTQPPYRRCYAVRCFFRNIIPSNATPPIAIIDHVEGSGTDATAIPLAKIGVASGGTKLAAIRAPVVALYSLTVPGVTAPWRDTKRSLPDNA